MSSGAPSSPPSEAPARARETARDRARRALVTLAVGPSRAAVMTGIGSVMLFVLVIVIGYFTRK